MLGMGGMTEAARLFAYVGADTREYEQKMRQASQTAKETSRGIGDELGNVSRAVSGGLGGIATILGVGAFAGLFQQTAALTTEMWKHGMQLQAAERSYKALSGEGLSGIRALSQATAGLVTNTQAMAAANQYMAMGLAKNSEEAGKLISIASRLALLMGRDVNGAVAEFAQLLANQSTRRLDQFGISATQVEKRVEALKNANKDLSTEAAFTQAVIAQANETLARAGDVTDTQESKAQAFKVAWQNLRAELGARIDASVALRVVTEFVQDWGEGLQGARLAEEMVAPARGQIERRWLELQQSGQLYRSGATEISDAALEQERSLLQLASALDEVERQLASGLITQEYARQRIEEITAAVGYWREELASGDAAMDEHRRYLRDVASLAAEAAARVNVLTDAQIRQAVTAGRRAGYDIIGGREPGQEGALRSQAAADQVNILWNAQQQALKNNRSYYSETESAYRQHLANMRSLIQSAMGPTSVTGEDVLATRLGVYQDKPDEYLRRLRSAVQDPQSAWKSLIADMSQEQAQLYLAQQERAYATGRWSQLGAGFDREAAIQSITAQVREAWAAQQELESIIAEIMARPEIAGLGMGQEQIKGLVGMPQDYTALGRENMQSFAEGMTGVNVGLQVTSEFREQVVAQSSTWRATGALAIGYFAEGATGGITPKTGTAMIQALWPFLAPMVQELLEGGRG